ncbi:MAG: flagellar hook-basal body complex protein [Clostridium sp.]
MLRSMYSGISGMKVNQIKLDVIGNNISNVGTTSYKSQRARFSEMLSQNVSDAMAPSNNQGGVNASQVGLGVQLASIDTIMTQGMMQPTGRALDVAIDGDGFFMVSKGPAVFGNELEVNHRPGTHTLTSQSLANSGSELMYTRDGSFVLDKEGNLLTGDGYRVMGYSLTNDDSSMQATGQAPNLVSTAGLDFKFGPGSQLNGYKVVLGAIGPQTVTSADVNKAEKTIVLNGDFSTPGALTTAQIESALNKSLSAAGISQSIYVSGKPVNFDGLASDKVVGGADATSPSATTIGGFTLQLSEGAELNGFTFEIGKIGTGTPLGVVANKDAKKITINGDFISKGALTGAGLKEQINQALTAAGISQQVTNVSGSPMSISQIAGKTDESGSELKGFDKFTHYDSVGISKESTTMPSVGGLTFDFEDGGQLNGYTIKFADNTAGTNVTVDLNTSNKVILIKGDITDTDVLKNKINSALTASGITSNKIAGISGTFDAAKADEMLKVEGGSEAKAAKPVSIANVTINFPKTDAFNGIAFEIVDVKNNDENGNLKVEYNAAEKKFNISGDFTTANKITVADLNTKINEAAEKAGFPITAADKIVVTGTPKLFTGLSSSAVEGGLELATPGSQEANGMDFIFGAGGSLNGYTIQIGNVSSGTKTSAEVDSKNKKIIINADLVNEGATSTQMIENAINKSLQEEGIMQSIKVEGKPVTISGVESGETTGGTPVSSINNDGTLQFVDGTQDLKAYDGELKTLRIPDKVRIPGTDQELRVKTYTIDSSGVINGVLEDGRVAALGQIAMASFNNAEGLTKLGGNLYGGTVNSGDPVLKAGVGTLGEDNSAGYGDNLQGMLEMSNVDLSEQFTDMIVSTRAFQAAGKMITTGDEILQDIINLKR